MAVETTCTDLLSANESQLQHLQNGVALLHGSLPVLIHPFYTDRNGDPEPQSDFVTTPNYQARRDKFISVLINKGYPLLIMEQASDIGKLANRMELFEAGNIFPVATKPASHQLPGEQKDWDKLTSTLRSKEVERLIIGGVYLLLVTSQRAYQEYARPWVKEIMDNKQKFIDTNPYASRWLKEDLMPLGCAGSAAAHFLASGFDIILSTIATPFNGLQRKD